MSRKELYTALISYDLLDNGRWVLGAIRMVEAEKLATAAMESHFCPGHLLRMAFRAAMLAMILIDIANGDSVDTAINNHVEGAL